MGRYIFETYFPKTTGTERYIYKSYFPLFGSPVANILGVTITESDIATGISNPIPIRMSVESDNIDLNIKGQ